MTSDAKLSWEEYRDRELAILNPLLNELGFSLDEKQPHIGGERYLMRAVTTASGMKLLLLGKETSTGRRVVIKTSSEEGGQGEIAHERVCKDMLTRAQLTSTSLLFPEELLFTERQSYTIAVQLFIETQGQFIDRPVDEQFRIALRALEAQEAVQVTTFERLGLDVDVFGRRTASDYEKQAAAFAGDVVAAFPEKRELVERALQFVQEGVSTIEAYGDTLTHTDFVPHNLRVVGEDVYLLDLSSLRFGNKYEGWARFLNFMELYNPELVGMFSKHVQENRPEEVEALALMRVYRLLEILWYYRNTLDRSEGDLLTLNRARIDWWAHVLERTLEGEGSVPETRLAYITLRDSLRSPEEKVRQQGLH